MTGSVSAATGQATGVVKGKITDGSGQSIVGAEALLCPVENGTPLEEHFSIGTTGSKGIFTIRNVPEGRYTLLFRDPLSRDDDGHPTRYFNTRWYGGQKATSDRCWSDSSDSIASFRVRAGQLADGRNGSLRRGGRLTGRTFDTNGNPVRNMQVSHTDVRGNQRTVFSEIGAQARYHTNLMPVGTHKVRFIDGRDGTQKTVTVTIERGRSTVRDIRFALPDNSAMPRPYVGRDTTNVGQGTILRVVADWYQLRNEPRYRWFRDGDPIDGATGGSYQVGPADAGHRLSVEVSGHLEGYPVQTYRLAGHRVPLHDLTVDLTGLGNAVPAENTRVAHAHVNVSRAVGAAPDGVVTIWDDSQGDGFGDHIKLGSGRVDEFGNVVIQFRPDIFWDKGEAYAQFVPDDPALTITRSETQTYFIED